MNLKAELKRLEEEKENLSDLLYFLSKKLKDIYPNHSEYDMATEAQKLAFEEDPSRANNPDFSHHKFLLDLIKALNRGREKYKL
jgi:hypothetical protein